MLRSRTPSGVLREVLGLMLAHYVVRTVKAKAAARAGVPPTRLGFTATVRVLRLARFPSGPRQQSHGWDALLAEVGREVLPPRRDRDNPRAIERKARGRKNETTDARRHGEARPSRSGGEAAVATQPASAPGTRCRATRRRM